MKVNKLHTLGKTSLLVTQRINDGLCLRKETKTYRHTPDPE